MDPDYEPFDTAFCRVAYEDEYDNRLDAETFTRFVNTYFTVDMDNIVFFQSLLRVVRDVYRKPYTDSPYLGEVIWRCNRQHTQPEPLLGGVSI